MTAAEILKAKHEIEYRLEWARIEYEIWHAPWWAFWRRPAHRTPKWWADFHLRQLKEQLDLAQSEIGIDRLGSEVAKVLSLTNAPNHETHR